MTGASTMQHHKELHERVEELEGVIRNLVEWATCLCPNCKAVLARFVPADP